MVCLAHGEFFLLLQLFWKLERRRKTKKGADKISGGKRKPGWWQLTVRSHRKWSQSVVPFGPQTLAAREPDGVTLC